MFSMVDLLKMIVLDYKCFFEKLDLLIGSMVRVEDSGFDSG